MSIDILEILKSKKSFLAHFWSTSDYFSSRWRKFVRILEWTFGFIYFFKYLRGYSQKTWSRGLTNMESSMWSSLVVPRKKLRIAFLADQLFNVHGANIFKIFVTIFFIKRIYGEVYTATFNWSWTYSSHPVSFLIEFHRPETGNVFEVSDIVNTIITFSDCEVAEQNLRFKNQSLFSKRFTAIPAKRRCYILYHCRLHISFP